MCLARYVAQVSSPHERHGTRGETPRKLAGEDACATRQTHGPAARGQLPRLRTGSGVQGAKFHLGDISLSTLRACVVCLPHAKKRFLLGKSWWAEMALGPLPVRFSDAPASPPWLQPKSLAAAPLVVFKQALTYILLTGGASIW